MSSDVNPYQSPRVPFLQYETDRKFASDAHSWQGRQFAVSAKMIPRFFPLLCAFYVTIDGKETFTSSQLRWRERFIFAFEHGERSVTTQFESYGLVFGGERYRLFVDGVLIADSRVRVDRWWIGFFLGIAIGAGCASSVLLLLFCLVA